jgi:hypothetical protein
MPDLSKRPIHVLHHPPYSHSLVDMSNTLTNQKDNTLLNGVDTFVKRLLVPKQHTFSLLLKMGKKTMNGETKRLIGMYLVRRFMISAQIVVVSPKKSIGNLDLKPIQKTSAGSVCAPKIKNHKKI